MLVVFFLLWCAVVCLPCLPCLSLSLSPPLAFHPVWSPHKCRKREHRPTLLTSQSSRRRRSRSPRMRRKRKRKLTSTSLTRKSKRRQLRFKPVSKGSKLAKPVSLAKSLNRCERKKGQGFIEETGGSRG